MRDHYTIGCSEGFLPSSSAEQQPFSTSAPARFHQIVAPNLLTPKLLSGSAPPLSHSHNVEDALTEAIKVIVPSSFEFDLLAVLRRFILRFEYVFKVTRRVFQIDEK